MNELLETISHGWGLLAGLITGVSGLVAGWIKWKQSQRQAADLIVATLEAYKTKLVNLMNEEIKLVEENAYKNRLLESFKNICPDCYERVLKENPKLKDEEGI